MACYKVVKVLFCIIFGFSHSTSCYKLSKNDEKCPEVRARSNCDLDAVRTIYMWQYTYSLLINIVIQNKVYLSTVSSNDNYNRWGVNIL